MAESIKWRPKNHQMCFIVPVGHVVTRGLMCLVFGEWLQKFWDAAWVVSNGDTGKTKLYFAFSWKFVSSQVKS